MAETDRTDPAPSTRLFSELPEGSGNEQRRPVVDDSAAAMQRLRTPFDAEPGETPGRAG